MVAIPGVASFAPDENYNFDKFIYDQINDSYTCPQHQVLTINGNSYQKSKRRNYYTVKHYKTPACAACSALAFCAKNKKGRLIENENAETNINQTKAIIYKYRKQYSGVLRSNHDNKFTTEPKKFESDLTKNLKQKFGLDFIFFTGKDKEKPYGYTIIDHHNREVYKGSDVLKLDYLINDSVINGQKDSVTGDRKIMEFQNNKNSPQNEVSKTLSEEKETDYVAGENTSNNEIQLGDLFEDFMRELEKENYEGNGRGRKKRRRRRGI